LCVSFSPVAAATDVPWNTAWHVQLLMLLLDEQRRVQSDEHTRKHVHQLTLANSHRISLQLL